MNKIADSDFFSLLVIVLVCIGLSQAYTPFTQHRNYFRRHPNKVAPELLERRYQRWFFFREAILCTFWFVSVFSFIRVVPYFVSVLVLCLSFSLSFRLPVSLDSFMQHECSICISIYFIGRIPFHGLEFATIVKVYDCNTGVFFLYEATRNKAQNED